MATLNTFASMTSKQVIREQDVAFTGITCVAMAVTGVASSPA